MSGKTTLAKHLSKQFWQVQKRPSLVWDIFEDDWGDHSRVYNFDKKDEFIYHVWDTQNMLVIMDEASSTIKRDKEFIPFFTRLRHNHHKLIVIGHDSTNLLPEMREQLDTLYLFRQSERAAKMWKESHVNEGLMQSTQLQQYEFLYFELYKEPQKRKLKL